MSLRSIHDQAIVPLPSSSSSGGPVGGGGAGGGDGGGGAGGAIQYLRIYPLTWSNESGPLFSEESTKSGLALVSGRVGAMRVSLRGLPQQARPDDQEQDENENNGAQNEGHPSPPDSSHLHSSYNHNHTHTPHSPQSNSSHSFSYITTIPPTF